MSDPLTGLAAEIMRATRRAGRQRKAEMPKEPSLDTIADQLEEATGHRRDRITKPRNRQPTKVHD